MKNLTIGDYGTVSPDYSDIEIPKEAMRNVIAPKIPMEYKIKMPEHLTSLSKITKDIDLRLSKLW